jgi:hypothetical protein
MSKQNEQKKRKKTYSQTSRLQRSEELQLHHYHEKQLFLTVLLLFAQCNTHYIAQNGSFALGTALLI